MNMKKVIILDISKKDYEAGLRLMDSAVGLAVTHGMYDIKVAERVFGEKGWFPPYDELVSLKKFKKKIKKGEIQ
jgi:hypothetical protein